jgi:alkanesulfonate monooxygenase SsuD/methylene tetrahydromethanopterin reductase-like flavin-dependent oxidoreductase (luciferase family)
MTGSLNFQVLVLPNAPWSELLARFKRVEDLGFDMVTTADHFVDWNDPTRPWLEGWSVLAAAAAATSRIRLATYVTQIPLRNPAMLARQALSVDQISDGRLEVGLGTGLTIDPSYDLIGMENWDNAERVARFEEYIQIVGLLLSNEVTSFKGRYYEVHEAVMNPRPIQSPRPPIVAGALGPKMMKIAAKHADKWNTMSFAADFNGQHAEVRDKVQIMDDNCAAIDRDPASLQKSFLMFDPASRSSGGSINYYQSDNVFVDQVGRLADIGFTEIGLYYPILSDEEEAFSRIATDIIPQLKRDHAG